MARIDVLSGNRKFFTVPFFITFVTIFLAAIGGDTTQVTKSQQKTLKEVQSLQPTQETLPTTTPTPSPTPKPTAKPTPLPTKKLIIVYPTNTPIPVQQQTINEQISEQRSDTRTYTGGDKDCPDFATHAEAQNFFIENGGPANDPHRLDGDNDGVTCETLP